MWPCCLVRQKYFYLCANRKHIFNTNNVNVSYSCLDNVTHWLQCNYLNNVCKQSINNNQIELQSLRTVVHCNFPMWWYVRAITAVSRDVVQLVVKFIAKNTINWRPHCSWIEIQLILNIHRKKRYFRNWCTNLAVFQWLESI